MQAHILLTRRRIVIALSTIWLLSTSLAVPVAVFDRTRRMGDEKVYCVLSLANTYDAHIVRWRIYKYLEFLILFLCPLIVQVVLYIRIQGKLRENTFQFDSKAVDNKNRNGNENENQTCRSNNTIKSRQRVIRMLTICVVIYFISFTPAQILLIYDTIASKPFHQTWLFRTFMLTLVFMNSAANPVIYCLCSETYRARFGVMYGCIKERERRMEQRSARGSTLRSVSSRTQSLRLTVQTSEDKPEVCQLEPVNENDILLPEAWDLVIFAAQIWALKLKDQKFIVLVIKCLLCLGKRCICPINNHGYTPVIVLFVSHCPLSQWTIDVNGSMHPCVMLWKPYISPVGFNHDVEANASNNYFSQTDATLRMEYIPDCSANLTHAWRTEVNLSQILIVFYLHRHTKYWPLSLLYHQTKYSRLALARSSSCKNW